ncbi:MAG: 16S rRNA (adenine(1518)-N(6)/adenine(1519)-N(6))-dimethyltransferase RsmA [Firmicutes bacterium]|jgi:16S rRNA (adenine1518-N6/adenine1519-N6)-dimethyltransferase|nr:16S rRNA (adenine(1518)-N(6)/adenine(1519)-N(6))-dimethyltransferase RsmA [Bacillota bacterium]
MKRLGQNFLVDGKVRNAIVDASGADDKDLVVEIGSGRGELTKALAMRAGKVAAIEIDPALVDRVKQVSASLPNIHPIQADVLSLDFVRLVAELTPPGSGLTRVLVVGNLPYYITTPILKKLIAGSFLFHTMVLMVQLEVAEKLVAGPGDPGYGPITIETQYHTAPEILYTVAPQAFDPPPAVHSAVVRFKVLARPPVEASPDILFELVRASFGQRRKSLRNSLVASHLFRGDRALVRCVLERACVDGARRAESLSLYEFAALARALQTEASDTR